MSASRSQGSPEPAGDGAGQGWRHIELPWRGVDRGGDPLELSEADRDDAGPWIEHLTRITTETPWMLQSEEDPLPSTLEQKSLLEEYRKRRGSLAIVARRPRSREILGTLTLAGGRSRRTEHAAELSMGVGQAWWNRGIGALLIGAGLTWAARSGSLRRVSLSVFQDNEIARRLYERVGFLHEGVLRRYVRIGTAQEDLVVMGIWLGGEP